MLPAASSFLFALLYCLFKDAHSYVLHQALTNEELLQVLIEKGLAYVCHQSPAQVYI
jgi:hypothetical protein